MIVYFADRKLNILGQASTELPKGFTITDDKKSEDVDTGVAAFECDFGFDDETRAKVEECVKVGNYILRKHEDENEFYTIIDSEVNVKKKTAYIYAEDAGLDLLNEVVSVYEADKAYSIDHYIEKFAYDSGFVIGINEASGLTRKLSWDGEETVTARLASVATQFDNCEISFSFDVKGLQITNKYINIYKKRGKDISTPLRLNKEVDNIVIKQSIANVATALRATGGTPEGKDDPITLRGYTYDDGDFYVDGDCLKSRKALEKWSRYINPTETNLKEGHEGHIVRTYSYDTTSQAELCTRTLTELKKICDMEVNYEADILEWPENTKIGDRVNIVDEKGELFLSARILQLEDSVVQQEKKAVFGEYLIKSSGISQKVIELAQQFAKNAQSAARALELAKTARDAAVSAEARVDEAIQSVEEALEAVQEVSDVVETAKTSAEQAQAAASNAQQVVDSVEDRIDSLETSLVNAEAAAEQARQAAETAEVKATEAHTAAINAEEKADAAETAAIQAQQAAESAVTKAEEAKSSAEQAIAGAKDAATTATAAKLDAEKAQREIDSLGENLTTIERTMKADYARNTDLTKAKASLQSQITQNAAGITSTVKKVQEIDETANNAKQTLQGALEWAEAAQAQADKAAEDAETAQAEADEAAAAATAAQAEADTAKAAADSAQMVADQAEAALKAAIADLATISERADATEEEIALAQQAVEAAQTAANSARENASVAKEEAAGAQELADKAIADADKALQIANEAARKASTAQNATNEARGEAEAAQAVANEAREIATTAQENAETALAEAETAQIAADELAEQADAAQQTANEAAELVTQTAATLLAAQDRLEEVLANVDATEEEVANAQADVDKAQAAATEAQTEATNAQTAADEARANATAAKTAADNAKQTADEAQAEAEEAWKAYDAAKGIVDGLAVRVTDAESQIRQNTEAIALRATKKEITKTLGGYSTKAEMEAAINVKADEITSSVTEKVEEVQGTAEDAATRINSAESIIQQLSDSIAQLVRGEEGGTLVKQDANGLWYFDISGLEKNISDNAETLGDLSGIVLDANGKIDVLKSTAAALETRTEYVRSYTDENGQPCLELGKGGSSFKVRITNTEIQFAEGTSVPAKINRQMLIIEKAIVKSELQFGDEQDADSTGVWIWKQRDNGNLGLTWKAVDS